ncbi:hypothetical protein GF371_00630 [Candidatus Woesearchaeota archaeon]|nr:hypothetical protein [Candidatus Woesearchaeota archaeon]
MPQLNFITDGSNYSHCIDEKMPGGHFVPFKFEYLYGHLYVATHYAFAKIVEESPPGIWGNIRDTESEKGEPDKRAADLWAKHDELLEGLLIALENGIKGRPLREFFIKQALRFDTDFYKMVEDGLKLDGSVMPFGVVNAEGRLKRVLEKRGYQIQFPAGRSAEEGILQQAHYLGV